MTIKKPPTPPKGGKAGTFRSGLLGALRSDWRSIARTEQLPPPGQWTTWIFCAGRGSGKTRSGAEWIQERVETGQARRIHLIAPTAADARDVMLEGPAGLLSVASSGMRPTYLPSLRKVEWPNGAQALLFSSDEPDRLRGPQCDTLWIDELCAMARAQDVLDMAMLGLRLGKDPKCLITTTPRPIKPFKKLVERDGQDVVITRCSTMANAENLARPFLSQILQQYQGTRLGRQELNAELLLDVPGALWTLAMLEETRLTEAPQSFQRIVIGVDPAGSTAEWADQTGIVVAALGHDGHLYVLEDASGSYTPSQWAQVVADLYHRHRADRICVERNFGGDMVEATIRTADPSVAVKAVTSSRGKILRAEPISALWEQKRAHVVGSMPSLEDQLCNFTHTWDRARDGSPDRLDAMVFASTELTSGAAPGAFFSSAALLVDGQPIDMGVDRPTRLFTTIACCDQPGTAVGVIHWASCPHYGYALRILDYDLVEVDQMLANEWLTGIYARAKELQTDYRVLEPEISLMVEQGDLYEALMLGYGNLYSTFPDMNLYSVESEKLPPTLPERTTKIRALVNCGTLVKLASPAFTRQMTHRSSTTNHFVSQVLGYLPGRDTAQELVSAFALGVLQALDRGM